MSKIIKNGVTYGGMPTVSGNISYDNTSSGLNAITVQNAITELKEIYDLPKGYAWAGTQDEWDALSAQEKQIYDDKVVLITDDVENSFQRTLLYDSGSYDTGAAFQTDINLLDNLSHYDIVGILCGNDTDNTRDDACYGDMRFFDVGYLLEENTDNSVLFYYSGYDTRWMAVQFTDTTFNIVKGEGNSGSTSPTNRPTIYKIFGYKFKGTIGPGGGSGDLTAADIAFSDTTRSASIYTNVTNVEEALMAVKGGINSLDAEDISYTPDRENGTFCGGEMTVAGALDQIDSVLIRLSAEEIRYSPSEGSIYGNNVNTVEDAFGALDTIISGLDTDDIAFPSAKRTGIYANSTTAQDALDAIKTALDSGGGGGGSSSASSVSFTKPQGGIYESSTDTVQEALEDVSAKVLDLAASDIVYVNGCGGSYPTEVETVHDALECLQHLLLKYSESETETGWLWFNDKPIYQVSVEVESGTTNLFDTNELEIDDLVYMEATLTNSGGTKRWTISGSSGDFYWNTATHMIVYGGSDVVTTATIRYTKTSD